MIYAIVLERATLRRHPRESGQVRAVPDNEGLRQTCVQIRHETREHMGTTLRLVGLSAVRDILKNESFKPYPTVKTILIRGRSLIMHRDEWAPHIRRYRRFGSMFTNLDFVIDVGFGLPSQHEEEELRILLRDAFRHRPHVMMFVPASYQKGQRIRLKRVL